MENITFENAFPYIVSLCSVMFVVSGVQKLTGTGNDLERLAKKLPAVPENIVKFIIIAAGLWELAASFGMVYSSFKPTERANLGAYSAIALAIFTIIATVIFYVQPFRYFPFISNVDTVAGLLLIFLFFKKFSNNQSIFKI